MHIWQTCGTTHGARRAYNLQLGDNATPRVVYVYVVAVGMAQYADCAGYGLV